MKRTLLALLGMMIVASGAMAAVQNTPHDLSSNISNGPQQICVFCHTPHNANQVAALDGSAPLWNHTVTSNASYSTYTSPTFDATGTGNVTVSDTSGLCMSCHDGTIAPGEMYNEPNGSGGSGTDGATVAASILGVNVITGNADLGADLTNDHPVNFNYASSVTADGTGELVDAATVASYLDAGGKMQCASCHDPHEAGADSVSGLYFMRVTVAQSQLCTTCHIK